MTAAVASGSGRGTVYRRVLTGPAVRVGGPALVVLVIFAGVLPRITDYAAVWVLIEQLRWPQVLLLAALAAANLLSYAPVWTAALPGLRLQKALLVDQASTAVANTVPIGFAFGVGTTATMYHSFGFSAGEITRAVALTGIWNDLVKLGMPLVALVGLTLTDEVPHALLLVTLLGLGLLAVALGALVLTLTHASAAALLASLGQRVVRPVARLAHRPAPVDWVQRVELFRADSLDMLRSRWPRLTVAAVGSHLALFVLLLACVRLVGRETGVGWLEVLVVFSITRLVTIIPITPGAIGVAELSYVAGFTAVGMSAPAAAAGVLLFRFLTWFLPIPTGAVAWLLWRFTAGKAARPEPALSGT